MNQIAVGVITVSDRAYQGLYKNLGGPALKEAALGYGWQILAEAIVPDDIVRIRETIRSFSSRGCGLILTTGGMRAGSLKLTPNAILSRSLAAIVDRSLVIALPGNPQGAADCLGFVAGAIPHSVEIAQEIPTSC
jgi:molybdopterin adenylyltransferase